MSKQIKTVLSILIVWAIAANLASFALQIPVVESDPDAEIENELNDLEADLTGKRLAINIIDAFAVIPKFQQGPSYLLRLFQAHLLFIPCYQTDLHGLSPPQINL